MLIKDIEAFKSTGKHVMAESVDPETGAPIEVETFFDEKTHRSYEVDRPRKRYRESNVIGEYGEWEREKAEGFYTNQAPSKPHDPQKT